MENEKQNLKQGDLVKVNDCICLVIEKKGKENLTIIMLEYDVGNDWRKFIDDDYQQKFEEGQYELFSKAGLWGVTKFEVGNEFQMDTQFIKEQKRLLK